MKKKKDMSITRSSAAEYLTFITATGKSDINAVYFEEQLQRIREIRLSERRFYQKVTDIYATSIDYDSKSQTTRRFFAKVQNQLHWAIHGETAAEVIYHRADSGKEHMGLQTWKDSPNGKIQAFDVIVAKNYLTEDELSGMARIVNAYLDLAEMKAEEQIPMTMEDWAEQFEGILRLSKKEILTHAGTISAKIRSGGRKRKRIWTILN